MNASKNKLSNFERIENTVDSVTLFKSVKIPDTKLSMTIGTVYNKLLDPELRPKHFCYINLSEVNGIDRSLHIRSTSGDLFPSQQSLKENGITELVVNDARKLCHPTLIIED